MPVWLTEHEHRVLSAVCDRLVPSEPGKPSASSAGAPQYIDQLLGAFLFDPPRIWAGGPCSGRHGGEAGFSRFHRLTALDELAWRTRIEGSCGYPERELNGPVVGWQTRYRQGLAELGSGFVDASPGDQDAALRSRPELTSLIYEHVCEAMYGAPEYGGNRGGSGWRAIGFVGDVQPRGWSPTEVTTPDPEAPLPEVVTWTPGDLAHEVIPVDPGVEPAGDSGREPSGAADFTACEPFAAPGVTGREPSGPAGDSGREASGAADGQA